MLASGKPTCVDEVLVGHTRMVHIMNRCSEDCSHYFKWCKNRLKKNQSFENGFHGLKNAWFKFSF